MKTICFDLRALQIGHQDRGIGKYLKSVLEHLPADKNKYLFYVYDKNDPLEELGIKFANQCELVKTPYIKTNPNSVRDVFNSLRIAWHSFGPLKSKKPDVFVQFDFALGIPKWRRTKTVVIAYDLIPMIKKVEYMPTFRFVWNHARGEKAKIKGFIRSAYFRIKYRIDYRVYKKANQLISISESTADSFKRLLGIDPRKIRSIPLAPVLSKKIDEAKAKKIGKPYIFYIGGTDSRKRVADIIYAFNIARGRGADLALVLAGKEFKELTKLPDVEARNTILCNPYKDDIHLLGLVSDAEKMGLYKNALGFVFCSIYEGFGLPIVEAMSAGCPVISYNNSSIPEAAGNAALLVDTSDYVAVANHILSLKDEKLRASLVRKGQNQAAKFNWQTYVKAFNDVLHKG